MPDHLKEDGRRCQLVVNFKKKTPNVSNRVTPRKHCQVRALTFEVVNRGASQLYFESDFMLLYFLYFNPFLVLFFLSLFFLRVPVIVNGILSVRNLCLKCQKYKFMLQMFEMQIYVTNGRNIQLCYKCQKYKFMLQKVEI